MFRKSCGVIENEVRSMENMGDLTEGGRQCGVGF